MEKQAPFTALLDFLDLLDAGHIYYTLRYSRPRMMDVDVSFPDGRWEVSFGEDGDYDVEKFVSREGVGGEEMMAELETDILEVIQERKERI
jgi:hypothetical protein